MNNIKIQDINSPEFKTYGSLINGYDTSELIEYMKHYTDIPEEGNVYIASDSNMEVMKVSNDIKNYLYGEMDIQIGYCNGKNDRLNGLEYHKCTEINIAVTDMVLLLGKVQEIENNMYDSKKVKAFFIPKGTAIELYSTTLHFAPCKVNEKGFKCIVILQKGTNLPLTNKEHDRNGEDKLLFAKNKWLIVHKDKENLVKKGAYAGIVGENIQINYSN